MSKRILAVAALAAVSLATPAGAGSLDFQGLSNDGAQNTTYLRSDLRALDSNGPLRRRPPRYEGYGSGYRPRTFATIGVGGFDPSNQPGSGLFVNGAVGTEFQSPIDLGASLSWYHRSTGGSEFITTFEDPAGNQGRRVIQTDNIDTDLVPLMAFVRVRFPVGSGVQPYAGAGAGWEWLHVEGVDRSGFAFANDYDGFGAQFFGGVNMEISPNTAVYGEVLYNASTVSADFYDPVLGLTVRDEIDMDGAGAHAGLRFRF